jgi:carbon-monoxide dehydrogenase large subunit
MAFDPLPPASSRKQGSRVEDNALVRGAGRFVDDAPMPGALHAHFLRSPHAHAKILSVDIAEARKAPGVKAVMTAADMTAANVTSVARHVALPKLVMPLRPPLADGRVLHVGQPVAAVIAETARQARDAAEMIAVDYEVLPSVVDVRSAIKPDAPQLWPEAPGNIAIDWPGPHPDPAANAAEVDRIIREAAHVARVSVVSQRIVVAALETRGATASYDPAADLYTLRSCSQGAGTVRDMLASIMGIGREKLRVISEDVGGAFGMKSSAYPEYPVLLVAARQLGQPVHWMADRSEAFVSDNQGRDSVTDAELALDEKGKILALRARHLACVGGFLANTGAHLATSIFAQCLPGMYRIPKIDVGVRCVFTNTLPLGPYRGAGRPEANYMLERLVDEAARVTGIDRARLRKRNLIPPSAMPYKTPVGTTFDSGDFAAVFDKAIDLSGYAEFKQRRRESAKRGRWRGLGISCFLEQAGGSPIESAVISFPGGDVVSLGMHVQSTGQGHATVFSRLVAQKLGIAPEQVRHRHGDTNLNLRGGASVGSRSAMTAGSAAFRAAETVIVKGRMVAAKAFGVAEDQVAYHDGYFAVAGTNHRLSLFDAAGRAKEMAARGEIKETLDTNLTTESPSTYPNGCHIAEVEVDPETGKVETMRYTAVDDSGRVLDHVVAEGQLHGGIAQGLGQALMEIGYYDPDNGQLVTGSFQDYAMPRADDMPPITVDVIEVPATTNPLGVKGIGEAGTTGSLAAITNAVIDAIPGNIAASLDMPATAEKVWALCQQAKAAQEK